MPKNSSRRIARDRFWSANEKQNYNCPDCGRGHSEVNGTFEVHHQNGNAYDNKLDNLIALCQVCHALREDRSPSKDAVRNLREQSCTNQTEKSEKAESQTQFLLLDELRSKIRQNVLVYNWCVVPNSNKRISDYLGYESGEQMFSITPKNRREAALFLSGRETASRKIHEIIQPMFESARSNANCVVCGSGQEDSCGLVSMPDENHGNVSDRSVFCGSCGSRILDMVDGPQKSYDDISEKMSGVVDSSYDASPNSSEESSPHKLDYDICHMSGCDNEPDVIYQIEDSPRKSMPNPNALVHHVCNGCKQDLNQSSDFPEGRVLADIDYIFEHGAEFS